MIHETDTTRGAPATAGIPARADTKPARTKGAKPKAAKAKARPAEAKTPAPAPSSKGPPPLTPEVLGHGPGGALSEEDRAFLAEQEAIIESGAKCFIQVGHALIRIRDHRDGALWRAQYDTFQNYCRVRWGFEPQQGYRLMDAAEVAGQIDSSPIGDELPDPACEGQLRPLAKLKRAEDRCEAWRRATDSANGEPVTARHVGQVVRAMLKEGAEPRSERAHQAKKARKPAESPGPDRAGHWPDPEAGPPTEEDFLRGLDALERMMAAPRDPDTDLSPECIRRSREFSRNLNQFLDAAEARARGRKKVGPPPDAGPRGGAKKGAKR